MDKKIPIPKNPAASLDALAASSELTLGKMAVLCRINSPILAGDATDIPATLTALWVLASPFDEVVANRHDLETPALLWGERMAPAEYRRRIASALDAVASYFEMLPRKEPDPKKKTERAGNGQIAELAEWLCRKYGWTLRYVLHELPAVQAALLWRCYSQGPGGLKSGTLAEDEIAFKRWGVRP